MGCIFTIRHRKQSLNCEASVRQRFSCRFPGDCLAKNLLRQPHWQKKSLIGGLGFASANLGMTVVLMLPARGFAQAGAERKEGTRTARGRASRGGAASAAKQYSVSVVPSRCSKFQPLTQRRRGVASHPRRRGPARRECRRPLAVLWRRRGRQISPTGQRRWPWMSTRLRAMHRRRGSGRRPRLSHWCPPSSSPCRYRGANQNAQS
jgi:hypothetical protein